MLAHKYRPSGLKRAERWVYNGHQLICAFNDLLPHPKANIMDYYTRSEFEAAASLVQSRTVHKPRIAIVLGSGLGALADSVQSADIIPYEEIPHWPRSTVVGHSGRLHIGLLEGQSVMMMQGRSHFYEGYPLSQIVLPVRVMQLMGIEVVVLTNAAGGLVSSWSVGDLMLITDHINLVGLSGHNPLIGPNDESLGPRFPNMSDVYDKQFGQIALSIAEAGGIPLHKGVYVGVAGPSFETPAEVRFLSSIGASAVGMSTVHEAVTARHAGMRVVGFSGITNIGIDTLETEAKASHEEVIEAGKLIAPRLEAILRGLLQRASEAL